MTINNFIVGAFFCYGAYTLQRPGFLADFMPKFWRLFPKKLHEPLFSCGVCVSSFWGIVFLILLHFNITIPIYLIAFCGACAVIDRAIKYFEYGYKYNPIPDLSNYSYLDNNDFRSTMIKSFLDPVISDNVDIIEIGGETDFLVKYRNYSSYDKLRQRDILNAYFSNPYFILVKGIAFEGSFLQFLNLLSSPYCKGFVIEGALSGISKTQITWILDKHNVIKMPYFLSNSLDTSIEAPDHCGGDVDSRIILIKEYKK